MGGEVHADVLREVAAMQRSTWRARGQFQHRKLATTRSSW